MQKFGFVNRAAHLALSTKLSLAQGSQFDSWQAFHACDMNFKCGFFFVRKKSSAYRKFNKDRITAGSLSPRIGGTGPLRV